MNLDREILFAKTLAVQAAELTLANFSLSTKAVWKSDNTPLTETDTAINQLVIDAVIETFPQDGVLGEEASFEAGRARLWVVDPIDGTQPFTLGAPLSSFCLSLVVDGQPHLGIIYDPYMNRMYWAVKDQGAFLNNKTIRVSNAHSIAQNFVMLSSRMAAGAKSTGQIFDAIEEQKGKAFNFRSFANASTYVAVGRAVGAIIGVPNAWDVAATKIIVEEAGGKVTDVHGNARRYDTDGDGLIASNGLVHEQLLKMMLK